MRNVLKLIAAFLFFCITSVSCAVKDITEDNTRTGDSTPDFILGKWEAVSVTVCYFNDSGEALGCNRPFEYGQGRLVLTFKKDGTYYLTQNGSTLLGKYKVQGNKINRDGSVSELSISGYTMHFIDTGEEQQQGSLVHWKSTLVLHKIE